MSIRAMISRVPGIGPMVARSMGWQQSMFGDLLGGGGGSAGDLVRPYGRSAWVRSAIGFVAAPIAMRPLVITADRRGGDVVVDDPELTAFWEKPGRSCGGVMARHEFIEATVCLLKLKGQAFWIMDDSWLVPRATKSRLILARPDTMHAVMSAGELVGWTHTGKTGRSALIPEQVVHLRFYNPYHDVLGLSEWEAAMIAAESDFAGAVFARNLARNNGDRGPYVIGKGGVFSDEQINQVTAQLRAKREMGRRGEFRAAFLPADVDVKEPGVSAVDSQFVTQRLENRKEIYAAFGVPPSFADPQASYSIGSASDRFRLIEDTCMPLAAKIADGMEVVCQAFLGRGRTIFVEFDWDSHSTMQQVRAERFKTATDAVDRGMPWRVAGEYFRLKLPRFAGDDVGRVPFNLQEIEKAAGPPQGTTTAEEDVVDDLEKLFAARSAARSSVVGGGCGCMAGSGQMHGQRTVSKRAQETWARIRKNREPWERKFKSRISKHLMDARGETLRNLAAATEGKAVTTRGLDSLDIIFDLDAWLKDWIKGLLGISRAAIQSAGMELWNEELGRDDALTMPAAEVIAALQVRENRIKGAGEKVWEAIKRELDDAIAKGETTDQIGERIRRKFAAIDKERGLVIAKTETTTIYEVGRDMVFRAAGVQWTQWLTSGLGNERLSHLAANEQVRPMGEPFEVGGHALAYPGDPDGPPQEVINCNCVRIAVTGPDGQDIEGNDDDAIPY